ncbi:CRISPR-associated ring nuclease Crn1 [Sulfurisphaera javensis]|uniref:CRISPR-associated ring nuclease Crn1 n=1 Tax=Sulfurisphaera javensis TaxID=2049879 RepID=A0AAT9GUZ9_9CREN
MVKLVATLGKSPGGIAETILNLSSGKYVSPFEPKEIKIEKLIVIRTKEVEDAYYTLKAILFCCLDFTNVEEVVLPFNDITSPQDFITVRETVRKALKAGDFFDFTGGRKAISSAGVLSARDVGAHLVTSIIDQDEYVKMNKRFEELKDRALNVYNKGQCLSYFCDLISSRALTVVFF